MYRYLLFGLLTLLMCYSIIADENITSITISAPASNDLTLANSYIFSGTYIGNSTTNISILYNNSVVCADTTVGILDSTWTCTGSLSTITECSALTLTASWNNITGGYKTNATKTGILGDGTNPSISSFTSDYKDLVQTIYKEHNYKVSGSDTCDTSISYSIVLTKPTAVTVTKTSNSSSWTETNLDEVGSYSAVATITDNAGNTATNTITFDAKGKRDDETVAMQTGLTQIAKPTFKQSNNLLLFEGIFLIISITF